MRFLVFILVTALLSIGNASAAERKLLAAPGLTGTAGAAPPAAKAFEVLRQKASRTGKLRVIVGLRVPFAAEGLLPAAEAADQRRDIAVTAAGLRSRFAAAIARDPETVRSYATLPFMALEVTPDELQKLVNDPAVISLSEDRPNRVNLVRSAPLVGAPEAWSTGFTGRGQTVAILDTGIDKSHPFLAGKVVSEACYSRGFCPGKQSISTAPGSGVPCLNRRHCKHGTHVAGIVAGKYGSFGGVSFDGVAKDATLISIMVFSRYGTGIAAWDSDIIAGLQRVYDLRNTFRIAAVNLSLGGKAFGTACDDYSPAMTTAIANLRSAGIATVVASGNGGKAKAISYPACISAAVSVGSVWDVSGWTRSPCGGQTSAIDKVACYSNAAGILKLLAPGSVVTSSVPGGGYGNWHGTSMATPHVAGAWALLKEKVADVSVDEALAAFESSGTPITDYRQPSNVTPRINVDRALARFAVITLSAEGDGLGSFTVSTPRRQIACSAPCRVSIAAGEQATVTAVPATASHFSGWQGACAGSGASCTLTVEQSTAVTALFAGAASAM